METVRYVVKHRGEPLAEINLPKTKTYKDLREAEKRFCTSKEDFLNLVEQAIGMRHCNIVRKACFEKVRDIDAKHSPKRILGILPIT